jgi:hypothetical protein
MANIPLPSSTAPVTQSDTRPTQALLNALQAATDKSKLQTSSTTSTVPPPQSMQMPKAPVTVIPPPPMQMPKAPVTVTAPVTAPVKATPVNPIFAAIQAGTQLRQSPERPKDLPPSGASLITQQAKPLAAAQTTPQTDMAGALRNRLAQISSANSERVDNDNDAWSSEPSTPTLSRANSAASKNKYHKSKITMKGGFYNY